MSLALIGLKLLGIGRWLKEAAGALFRWAARNPWQAAVIALCAFSGWLWWHDSRVIADRDKAIHVAAETINGMTVASEQNRKDQLAQKARVEQHYRNLADEADKEHAIELADANDALARYIRSHRLRAGEGGFNSSPASSTAEGGSAKGSERSGPETELVAVSPEDLQICTTNTMRLIAVRDWAINLDR